MDNYWHDEVVGFFHDVSV